MVLDPGSKIQTPWIQAPQQWIQGPEFKLFINQCIKPVAVAAVVAVAAAVVVGGV